MPRKVNLEIAIVSADELSGETAHLLRSPKNAERLLAALNRAKSKKSRPKNVAALRRELRLGKTK